MFNVVRIESVGVTNVTTHFVDEFLFRLALDDEGTVEPDVVARQRHAHSGTLELRQDNVSPNTYGCDGTAGCGGHNRYAYSTDINRNNFVVFGVAG